MSALPPENSKINPQIEQSWLEALKDEFSKPYFAQIKQQLLQDKEQGITVYPPGPLIFNAFNKTPFREVKVVILGQDPYHGPGQAHGLCFSVPDGIDPPPSLKNIFKELKSDIGIDLPKSGNLEKWATQGVFLLNAMLTVRANEAASHQRIGWQQFTDAIIAKLSDERTGLVFMLWGAFAKSKARLIDAQKHHILQAGHPSPLSERYFYGCRHFSKANALLTQQGLTPIDWRL
ncbi:MAG TPA: uracil-DNA glycosylase [Chitinophagales bacterium]|nr:uracil-DNA glycosylase [Chitinophagales bacterium]